jgi:hypothetical protein
VKRLLIVVAVLFAVVASATVAGAAVKKGAFSGTTTADDPVGFKVDSKGRVYGFYFAGVRLTCTDGDEFDSPTGADRLHTPSSRRFTVSSRKFAIKVRDKSAGNGWNVSGRFKSRGKEASGTFSIFANFDEQNQPDPEGSVKCQAELAWSAKRQ